MFRGRMGIAFLLSALAMATHKYVNSGDTTNENRMLARHWRMDSVGFRVLPGGKPLDWMQQQLLRQRMDSLRVHFRLELNQNHTYTLYTDSLRKGIWQVRDHDLCLAEKGGDLDQWEIVRLSSKKMLVSEVYPLPDQQLEFNYQLRAE